MVKQKWNKFGLVLGDIIGINLVFILALYLHFEGHLNESIFLVYLQSSVVLTIGKILIFNMFQLYDSIWEYASIEELMKVIGAVVVGTILGTLYLVFSKMNIYFGIYFIVMILEITYIGGSRFAYRLLRRKVLRQSLFHDDKIKKVLIIGSGATASFIATEIKNHSQIYGRIVGFVDDDPNKIGKIIAGVKVLGNHNDIYSIVARHNITSIILAIPTASNQEMKEVLSECKRCDVKVRILPGVREIIDGQVSMSKIRDVEIEDLLGREAIDLNVTEIAAELEGQVILVTGGGGSIGSEICRQLAPFNPKKLVLLDNYENGVYALQTEMLRQYTDLNLDVIIANIQDANNINRIMDEVRPTIIFHAAAHKHVPLMERSPKEAIKNNTFGTRILVEAADRFNVKRFVLISTDKAVNPTSVMGVSKRLCEMIIQGIAKQSETKFVAVRFGNVLGSNGSVIPLFKKQIEEGGPVTVTHKEIIRYFMTIREAAQLVIEASAIANGGEVFVLDMGNPVKVYDLAIDLIKLSGLKPYEDIPIEITGLRPGEKLYEELLLDGEVKETKYKKIYIGMPTEIDYKLLMKSFQQLELSIKSDDDRDFIELLQRIVPSYKNNIIVNEGNLHKTETIDKYRTLSKESVLQGE